MKHLLSFFMMVSVLRIPCANAQKTAETPAQTSNDRLLMTVAWFQHSAEMEALFYQGYNIATQRLDEVVAASNGAGNLAVVMDVDETVLDNSPHMTTVIQSGESSASWAKWVEKSKAKALPGALEFATYAQSRKVEIFYISNRKADERAFVLNNLRNEGFPYADDAHLLTRDDLSFSTGDASSKEGRRIKVAVNYEIILMIGDNLNDFAVDFEDRKKDNGKEAVETNRAQFGKKLILLPNPMYGPWQYFLWDFREDLSEDEKINLIKAKLIPE